MTKQEYERLKTIALENIENSSVILTHDFKDKSLDELAQINEIYQAELEAQNNELQAHILDIEEAQNELEVLFTHAPIPYILLTSKFAVLRANENLFKMFDAANFMSQRIPFYTHIHKGQLTTFLDWISAENKEHTPLEILLNTKNGPRYCVLHYHKWSQHESDVFLLSIIDIHTQKEQNDRFKALFENSQQGVIYLDKENKILDLNQTALDIIGEDETCILKKYTDLNWTFLDEQEEIIPYGNLPFSKAFQTKEKQEASVFSIHLPTLKTPTWIKMEVTPHYSADNVEVLGVFCIFTDVSKEHLLNKGINQELENFKTLGNNIPDIILRIDENQNILFANKKASIFFRLTFEQAKNIKVCDFDLFKSKEAKNLCSILDELSKLVNPMTYSLSQKVDAHNKNYFIRVIPEKTISAEKRFLLIVEDITKRIESEEMFNQLFFHASDAIILTDHHTKKIKSINSKARKLLQFDETHLEDYTSSDVFESFASKDSYTKHIDALDKYGVHSYETSRKLKNHETQYLKVYCTLIDIGNEIFHQSIVHDLTEHKLLELQLKQTSKVFEHTTEGILITDLKGNIISSNEAFSNITGYTREEIIGKNPSILQSGKHSKAFYKKMWNNIIKGGVFKGEVWNKKKDGTVYPEWLAISPIYNEEGKAIQYVAVFSDFSEIKKIQAKLENLAHYDALTKLPNRLLLHEQIKQSIKNAKRNKHQFAVLFIDLDRFKQINDTHGHETGDEVLKMTAQRLKKALREIDIVARLGGDEFIVVLDELTNIENVHIVTNNILKKLEEPFTINEKDHYISASIGISTYPHDTQNDDIDILLKNADIAMYESKTTGKNTYHIFSPAMAETVHTLSTLHNDLNVALRNNEFYLVYQPQYNVIEQKLLGFEALIRWEHPSKGEVRPDEFIPYAEQSQLILPIGTWVIEQAINDYYKIKEVLDVNFTIAVNVSHIQMNQEFIDTLTYLASKNDDFTNIIKIEITETSAMQNLQNTQDIIGKMKTLGFKISLDDFGTGYSALNAIKTLRVDEIKIDRSFIQDVPGDKDDEELVSTIIAMAKVMKKSVVAEGVETIETQQFLIDRRCPIIQGYLISKPMELEKTLAYLKGKNE